jgi:hypothetical protein
MESLVRGYAIWKVKPTKPKTDCVDPRYSQSCEKQRSIHQKRNAL